MTTDQPATAAWQTLTEAVERAERDDPAVAEAAARLDAAIDALNYQAELRRFRPLPWEKARVQTARGPSPRFVIIDEIQDFPAG